MVNNGSSSDFVEVAAAAAVRRGGSNCVRHRSSLRDSRLNSKSI